MRNISVQGKIQSTSSSESSISFRTYVGNNAEHCIELKIGGPDNYRFVNIKVKDFIDLADVLSRLPRIGT